MNSMPIPHFHAFPPAHPPPPLDPSTSSDSSSFLEGQPPDVGPPTPLSLRALVSSKEAGTIIGRGGQHVAVLREKTGVKAGLSKVVPRVHQTLTVSGTLESVAEAFKLIAQSFLDHAGPLPAESKNDSEDILSTTSDPSGLPVMAEQKFLMDTVHPNGITTVRLLISHALMGAIIGKQGMTIKAIQESSGAKMVATKEMLPNSTERVIDISGPPVAIQLAVTELGKYVASEWERAQGTVLYEPDPADGVAALAAGLSLGLAYGGRGIGPRKTPDDELPNGLSAMVPQGYGSSIGVAPSVAGGLDILASAATMPYAAHIASLQHQRVFSPTGIPAGSETSPAAVATAATQGAAVAPGGGFVVGGVTGQGPMNAPAVIDQANMRTQNIAIPQTLVGCIIGKGGLKITEIRRLSGSRISIAKCAHDSTGDRLFTIQGTPVSNEKALYMLYNQLETERERRASASVAQE